MKISDNTKDLLRFAGVFIAALIGFYVAREIGKFGLYESLVFGVLWCIIGILIMIYDQLRSAR